MFRRALLCTEKREASSQKSKTNVVVPKFTVGDFVLALKPTTLGQKCAFKWRGPHRITEAKCDLAYVVEPLKAGPQKSCIAPVYNLIENATMEKKSLNLC